MRPTKQELNNSRKKYLWELVLLWFNKQVEFGTHCGMCHTVGFLYNNNMINFSDRSYLVGVIRNSIYEADIVYNFYGVQAQNRSGAFLYRPKNVRSRRTYITQKIQEYANS